MHLKGIQKKTIAALKLGSVFFDDNEGSLRCFLLPTGDFGATHELLEIQGPLMLRQVGPYISNMNHLCSMAFCLTCYFYPLGPSSYGVKQDRGLLQTSQDVCACFPPRFTALHGKISLFISFPQQRSIYHHSTSYIFTWRLYIQ